MLVLLAPFTVRYMTVCNHINLTLCAKAPKRQTLSCSGLSDCGVKRSDWFCHGTKICSYLSTDVSHSVTDWHCLTQRGLYWNVWTQWVIAVWVCQEADGGFGMHHNHCPVVSFILCVNTFMVYSASYLLDSGSRYDTKLNILYLVDDTT